MSTAMKYKTTLTWKKRKNLMYPTRFTQIFKPNFHCAGCFFLCGSSTRRN